MNHSLHVFGHSAHSVSHYADKRDAQAAFDRLDAENVVVAVLYIDGCYVNDYSAERANRTDERIKRAGR